MRRLLPFETKGAVPPWLTRRPKQRHREPSESLFGPSDLSYEKWGQFSAPAV